MRTTLLVLLGIAVSVFNSPATSAQAEQTNLHDRVKQLGPDELKAVLDLAQDGDVEAQVMVGLAYQHGYNVPQVPSEAVEWYGKAADKGNSQGQHLLGTMYLNGEGVEKDIDQAHEWLRKSAEQGYAPAQCDYALLFLDGVGVAQDNAEAFKWFSLAAEGGSLTGLTYLGVMYLNGLGVTADVEKGLSHLREAANRGSPMAQANIGVMYANGVGVEQDVKEALIWLFMAERGGMDAVTPMIADMTSGMSETDLTLLRHEAQQRFEEGVSRETAASDTKGALPSGEPSGARAEVAGIGEWLATNLVEWGSFAVDMRWDIARARSMDEVGLTVRGSNEILDVSLEQCVLHYTVIQSFDPSIPPIRWEADIQLGAIDLSDLSVRQYTVPEGWRTVGGTRSEVYLRARNYPDLYFFVVDSDRSKRMSREVSVPILKSDYAKEVAAKIRRAAELCGAAGG
jgi:TPR repeat protein